MRNLTRTALIALLLSACGGSDSPLEGGDDIDATPQNEEVFVNLAVFPKEPAANALVTIGVNPFYFELVDPLEHPTPVAGEGHYRLYLDDELLTESHKMFLLSNAPAQPGVYQLRVELVANDGTPLDPPVTREIALTVK